MNKYVIIITILIITHSAAYYYGYTKPSQIQIKQVDNIKRDVVTVIKEVSKPNGIMEKTTTITDKTKEVSKFDSIQKKADFNYLVGVSYNIEDRVYKLDASRRIVGPVFGTLELSSNGNFFIGAKYEF